MEKYNRWNCREKHAAPQFTLKTGTIFEDSPLGLDKWLTALWMVVNCKNGVSSWEMHRTLGITQKSAWFMNHRIREALKSGTILRARAEHPSKWMKPSSGGMLERGGFVKAQVIPNRIGSTVEPILAEHVEDGSVIHSDKMTSRWTGGSNGLCN